MYAHMSREEWLFRGLAIATILALVGTFIMPTSSIGDLTYYISTNSYFTSGLDPETLNQVLTIWNIVVGINGLLISTAVGGSVGFAIGLASAVGLPL